MSIKRTLLIASMPAAALATAIGVHVVDFEGEGPTAVDAVTNKVIHMAYPDPAHGWAVPTICNGRTRNVVQGMVATSEECRAWLETELSEGIVKALARNVKVPVTPEQAVSLGAFMDNVGEGNFKSSALFRKLNAGDCLGAAREFNDMPQIVNGKPRIWTGQSITWRSSEPVLNPVSGTILWAKGDTMLRKGDTVKKWTTAAGVPLPGLIKRRAIERIKFENDCKEW